MKHCLHIFTPKFEYKVNTGKLQVELRSEDKNRQRRTGISRHTPNLEDNVIVNYPKDESEKRLIAAALSKNEFLQNLLEGPRLQAVVNAMYSQNVTAQEVIIQEDSIGIHLYVSVSGSYVVSNKDGVIEAFSDNRVFGELAFLYDTRRLASVTATSDGKLWVLEQKAYQQLMLRNEIEHQKQIVNFLKDVPMLNTVGNEILAKVSELVVPVLFSTGQVIIREGEIGDKFYIITVGTVTISIQDQEYCVMGKRQYFGELALLQEDNIRQASVIANEPVECFCLSAQAFRDHFGTIEDLRTIPDPSYRNTITPVMQYHDLELHCLKQIATLGVGSFGRVELVQHKKQKELTFAMKKIRKIDIVIEEKQKDMYNEKIIHLMCSSSNFIVQMYRTFKDEKYLYFLMELCLGGDLWSLLRKQRQHRFKESSAKFYVGCAVEALTYLHEHRIVCRDLKLENLLVDNLGYLKLTDFGSAKILDSTGKTYTIVGTPEYLPPEIILSKGHNIAVDYWALGILIFELLVGNTPFVSVDISHTQTYNLILKGIENVPFPVFVTSNASDLIKKLCQASPTDRLGCQKEGSQAVQDHKWFADFQWNALRSHTLKAPFIPKLKNNADTNCFERFSKEKDVPSNIETEWDRDF